MAGEFNAGFPVRPVIVPIQYGAGIVTNPKHMPICYATPKFYNQGAAAILIAPASIPQDFQAATVAGTVKVTILSISGSGSLTHIVTPLSTDSTTVTNIEIIIDGINYNFPITNLINYSIVIGSIVEGSIIKTYSTAGSSIDTATNQQLFEQDKGIGSGIDSGHNVSFNGRNSVTTSVLPTVRQICNYGLPRLRFEKSIVVMITNTSAISGNYCAGFILD